MSLEHPLDQPCYGSETEWSDFDQKYLLDDTPGHLARDLLDSNLPAIEPKFETLLEKVTKTLKEEDAYETITKFAREMHDVVADQEPDWVEMAYRRYGTGESPAHVATTMTLMLLVAPTPQPDPLFEEGADHVSLLFEANEELCFRFLKTWGEAWRDQHLPGPFDFSAWVTLGRAYLELKRSCGLEAGKLTSKALCVAAPDKEHQKKRTEWYKALFKAFHPHLKDIFPDTFLAQVALDGDLVHELSKTSLQQVISFWLTANEELPNNFCDSLDNRILTAFLKCISTHLSESNSARTILPDGFWSLTQSILGHVLVETTKAGWKAALARLLTEALVLAAVNLELNNSIGLAREKQKANRTISDSLSKDFSKLFEKYPDVMKPHLDEICSKLYPDKVPGMITALGIKLLRKKPTLRSSRK